MKVPVFILVVGILASCSKQDLRQGSDNPQNNPISCEFGQSSFNLTKREAIAEELTGKGKPPRFNWSNVTGGTGSTASVILLDFDGHLVSGTGWNSIGNITCAPANLSYEATGIIFNRIANDYSPFNVIVTTDEAIYNNAASNKRMRVIFTESWEWFGQAGGAAFLNSFGMTNNTPCFVFTSLLNYNPKSIAEAGAHEMGHTLGLNHQSSYNGTALVNAYNFGVGSGQTGWAPIMGCGYYRNLTTWHNGPTAEGYNSLADEVALLNTKLGAIPDDYSPTTTGAQTLAGSKTGVIHHSGDVDCFYVNATTPVTINAVPFNVGAENAGSNLDIVLKVYNSQGQLINTVNDPALLNASAALIAGEYFVSVSVEANVNAASYGMMGKYSISVN